MEPTSKPATIDPAMLAFYCAQQIEVSSGRELDACEVFRSIIERCTSLQESGVNACEALACAIVFNATRI